MKAQLIVLLFATLLGASCAGIQCLDKSSNPIDWFVIFKMNNGLDYYYCDSKDCSSLKFIDSPLNDPAHSPLFTTLGQIQKTDSEDYGTLFWNDEPPGQSQSASYAHSKGVIGYDSKTGFILSHSVPLFPTVTSHKLEMNFPEGEQIYAQSMMCISTTFEDIEAVGAAYLVDHPDVYEGNVPSSLTSKAPNMAQLIAKKRDTSQQSIKVTFKSLGGKTFYKYGKNKDWTVGFYENVLRPGLGVGIYAETWGHCKDGLIDAECTGSDKNQYIYSVLDLNFGTDNVFSYTSDHSKWAVSVETSKPWFCISDINRVDTQYKRGGGAICLNEKDLYTAVKNVIVDSQKCTKDIEGFLQ